MRCFKLLAVLALVILALSTESSVVRAETPPLENHTARDTLCHVNLANTLILSRQHPRRVQTWLVNQDCTVTQGPIKDVSPKELKTLFGTAGPGWKSSEVRLPDQEPRSGRHLVAIPNTTNSTCHAFERMVDPIGLKLTQIEAVLSWSWDGSYVRSTWNRRGITSYFGDGWHVTDGPHMWLYGPALPATYQDFAAWASFAWIGESYPHTLNTRAEPYYNGDCGSTGYYTGSIVPGGWAYYGGFVTTP